MNLSQGINVVVITPLSQIRLRKDIAECQSATAQLMNWDGFQCIDVEPAMIDDDKGTDVDYF